MTDTYRRYLRSLLRVSEPQIADALGAEITASPFLTKGPLLEATPPYATGATLRQWVEDDTSRQDLVRASRVDMPAGPFWGPLAGDAYLELAMLDDPGPEILRLAGTYGFRRDDPGVVLAHEQRMARLRGHLAGGPLMLADAARTLFDAADSPEESLAALVAVGGTVRDGSRSPVLSARYHLFARATGGAFTCLTQSGPHVSLGRHEICATCAGAMFRVRGVQALRSGTPAGRATAGGR